MTAEFNTQSYALISRFTFTCILYDAVAGGFTDSSGLLAFRFNFLRPSFTQPRDTSCPPSVQLAISNKEMEKQALATSTPRSPVGIVGSSSHATENTRAKSCYREYAQIRLHYGWCSVSANKKNLLRWTRRPPVVWAPILCILLTRSN